jgi:glyoxylase-like metal-dependent hydrolase (beta-lactamase superfamily II)
MSTDRLYFRQLLSGRELAHGNLLAHQLMNFVYLVGDRETGEAVVIDPAHDVDTILEALDRDGMHLTAVLPTHYHPDHMGGELMREVFISGVAVLLERCAVPVHVQAEELSLIKEFTGVDQGDLVVHAGEDTVTVGAFAIELLHTPGHTPGSQCFYVEDRLFTGDTLFADGCGHTEMPGSDPVAFYYTLTERLARIPDSATLYPGHLRAGQASAPLGQNRRTNFVFGPRSEAEWLELCGPGGCDGARPISLWGEYDAWHEARISGRLDH